jgi:3-deoxy-D-manno-octulosonate 8-phosphate phosphatase (KDO 8-P phosphatase)
MPITNQTDLIKSIKTTALIVFDFDGVFTDNSVLVDENGIESVRCSRSDGLGLRKLDEISIPYCIISTEKNPVVSVRAKKLGISVSQGHDVKLPVLINIANLKNIPLENIAYVGNDINDLDCLNAVGLPIAVGDAYPEVVAVAAHKTERLGGDGAVREICDLFYEYCIEKSDSI